MGGSSNSKDPKIDIPEGTDPEEAKMRIYFASIEEKLNMVHHFDP